MDALTLTVEPALWRIGGPALLLGLLVGLGIAWLFARSRARERNAEISRLYQSVKNQDEMRIEREQALQVAASQLSGTFAGLANESLKSNSETFLRLAEQNLGTQQERARRDLGDRQQAIESLVSPIRKALDESRAQIEALEKSRSEAYGGIRAQLESMQANQETLAQETRNLVNALRRPEVRGRWGELTLRRLVELAGMVQHCDFVEQVHTTTDDGAIRPDMIIRMPEQRELVVDVKAPLDAYLDASAANTDAERKEALERHARNVHDHVRKLSAKSYWRQFDSSPEFVILFIPGDQYLSAALDLKPELIDEALSRQVILATPTSLIALLKSVAYGWRQLSLAENATEIRRLAEDLHDRLGVFVAHLGRMGKQLASSVDSYNRAVGSLERKVLPGARRFVELGAQSRKPIEELQTLDATPRSLAGMGDEASDPLADSNSLNDPGGNND